MAAAVANDFHRGYPGCAHTPNPTLINDWIPDDPIILATKALLLEWVRWHGEQAGLPSTLTVGSLSPQAVSGRHRTARSILRIGGLGLGSSEVVLPFPMQIPGQDGAGVIDAVGPDVDDARIGDAVWVYHAAWGRLTGTAAESVVVPSGQAVAVPEGIGLEQAALAEQAGADLVVNYRELGAADRIRMAAPTGVERILELALATNLELDLAVIRRGGTIMTYSPERADPALPVARLPRLRRFLERHRTNSSRAGHSPPVR